MYEDIFTYDPHGEPFQHFVVIQGALVSITWEAYHEVNHGATLFAGEHSPALYSRPVKCQPNVVQFVVKDADALILVYDVSNRASFEALNSFYEAALPVLADLPTPRRKEATSGRRKPVAVLAHKADLPREEWLVGSEEGRWFAEGIGARFWEGSAKENTGLSEMTMSIMESILWNRAMGEEMAKAN